MSQKTIPFFELVLDPLRLLTCLFVRFKIMPDTTGQEPVDKQEHEEQPCNEESKVRKG